jgi:hypothetical protein
MNSQSPLSYYVCFTGKLPRKRKSQRFEVKATQDSTKEAAQNFILENKIKEASDFVLLGYREDSTKFTDVDGIEQEIVFRNLFPSFSKPL